MENFNWINVKDELPKTENGITTVIGFNGHESILVNFFNEDEESKARFRAHCLKCFNDVTDKITHWIPLPENPEK